MGDLADLIDEQLRIASDSSSKMREWFKKLIVDTGSSEVWLLSLRFIRPSSSGRENKAVGELLMSDGWVSLTGQKTGTPPVQCATFFFEANLRDMALLSNTPTLSSFCPAQH
eukprot:m51a1_g4492 hypothetical protein (112) ;mRNA; r:326961-327423